MQTILDQLKLKAKVVKTETNGTILKHYISLLPGAKVSKIENCATEIAIGMKAFGKPIIRVLPEHGLVCIEMLIKPISKVGFGEFSIGPTDGQLPIVLGRSHDGNNIIADLVEMPHLLIAGSTGSGKSVLLHSIVSSIVKYSSETRLALIDPKQVELSCYSEIKQLLYPIVIDPETAMDVLSDLVEEMDDRFNILRRAGVNNIRLYNEKRKSKMPYIVLAIDEFSDIIQSSKKDFQSNICRLAQKARACGIHIVLATQRPSVDVITGVIKANFSSRISCKVSSLVDSRVVLDRSGAEKLYGKGDSLINSSGFDMIRFQGAYISKEEIEQICKENERTKLTKIINYFRGL